MEQFARLFDIQSIKVLLDIPESYIFFFFKRAWNFLRRQAVSLTPHFTVSLYLGVHFIVPFPPSKVEIQVQL